MYFSTSTSVEVARARTARSSEAPYHRSMLRSLTALSALVLLTACTSAGGGEPSPSQPRSPSSLQPAGDQPTATGGSETITGKLGADAIEGGCAYLQTDKGTRYEVLYPKGWKLDKGRARLTDPHGEVVATAGDTVTVRGATATDMASICQIGPIFRADEVVTIDR